MSSAVQVAARSGTDAYGKPSYGTATTYRGHVARKRHLVLNANQQVVASEQSVYLSTKDQILPNAQVTLSTGDVGSTESWAIHPIITSVERLFDQHGAHHVVLHFALLLCIRCLL